MALGKHTSSPSQRSISIPVRGQFGPYNFTAAREACAKLRRTDAPAQPHAIPDSDVMAATPGRSPPNARGSIRAVRRAAGRPPTNPHTSYPILPYTLGTRKTQGAGVHRPCNPYRNDEVRDTLELDLRQFYRFTTRTIGAAWTLKMLLSRNTLGRPIAAQPSTSTY